jgi:hypothetical protein
VAQLQLAGLTAELSDIAAASECVVQVFFDWVDWVGISTMVVLMIVLAGR